MIFALEKPNEDSMITEKNESFKALTGWIVSLVAVFSIVIVGRSLA